MSSRVCPFFSPSTDTSLSVNAVKLTSSTPFSPVIFWSAQLILVRFSRCIASRTTGPRVAQSTTALPSPVALVIKLIANKSLSSLSECGLNSSGGAFGADVDFAPAPPEGFAAPGRPPAAAGPSAFAGQKLGTTAPDYRVAGFTQRRPLCLCVPEISYAYVLLLGKR